MEIGQFIKEIRLKKGLTQEELGNKTNISVRTIQRIENGEVAPRLYTLQSIATVLEIDYEKLVNYEKIDSEDKNSNQNKIWLPILHLSGLPILLFPPIIIWIWQKNKIKNIKRHAVDVVNFQLSMLIYLIPSSFLSTLFIEHSIVIFLGLLGSVIIVINTIKVINNQPYYYPLTIKILNP